MSLDSVVTSQKKDGSWQSVHVPSGKVAHGLSAQEAMDAMRDLLGVTEEGTFDEPLTSERFDGVAREVAQFLEQDISTQLAAHSGFARLEALEQGQAHVRLGGGCQGCPSSLMTLMHGVKTQLQERFGEDVVAELIPVAD